MQATFGGKTEKLNNDKNQFSAPFFFEIRKERLNQFHYHVLESDKIDNLTQIFFKLFIDSPVLHLWNCKLLYPVSRRKWIEWLDSKLAVKWVLNMSKRFELRWQHDHEHPNSHTEKRSFTTSIHTNKKLSIIKGQLISKCLLKKRTKKSDLSNYYGTSSRIVFGRFLEELEDTKNISNLTDL